MVNKPLTSSENAIYVSRMMNTGEILKLIAEFCARHGMSDTKFGIASVNDGHFVRKLKMGRSVGLARFERVYNFMEQTDRRQAANEAAE